MNYSDLLREIDKPKKEQKNKRIYQRNLYSMNNEIEPPKMKIHRKRLSRTNIQCLSVAEKMN